MAITNVDLIPVLQTAIGPVIVISGIGLLLLTMTNRLGRTIDRARDLNASSPSQNKGQLAILWLRARILRLAILFASIGALCAALLVISLFLTVLMGIELAWLIGIFFIGGMVLVIGSILLFIRDINLSLGALQLEMAPEGKKNA